MDRTARTVILALAALLLAGEQPPRTGRQTVGLGSRTRQPFPVARRASGPAARWVGQDQHDFVGTSAAPGGNGVQDIHIVIGGIPTGRTIKSAVIRGQGGDEWQFHGGTGSWYAAVTQQPGATTADLYLEPGRPETGRGFELDLTFDTGLPAHFWLQGGKADPSRRMPGAALRVQWVGQNGQDRTGLGPAVGPDGLEDVCIRLENLVPGAEIKAVRVEMGSKARWQSGANLECLHNAELARSATQPAAADLYFQPDLDLRDQTLQITIHYADGKTDRAALRAGACDPHRAMSRPALPVLASLPISATWRGQDGHPHAERGEVHLALDGLPEGRKVVAAALSDPALGSWCYRGDTSLPFQADPYAWPLKVRPRNGTTADLFFPPTRDETGSTLSLRLLLDDGQMAIVSLAGGFADTSQLARAIATTEVTAKPGDDLAEFAARGGVLKLQPGEYRLSHPLVLSQPIRIEGQPGAVLSFSQDPGDAPWTAAIKIHAGGTTLEGFAVRFAGPVRWRTDVNYGPAVIGSTDQFDPPTTDPKIAITLRKLDLEGPPAERPGTWQETPRLIRLATATSGVIAENRLKGGTTEFQGGPWRIEKNQYLGTPASTYCFAAFSGHHTHDLRFESNQAKPQEPTGKTWRFLVLSQRGAFDQIRNNTIEGIGPKDDDRIPAMNAPEVVLTEAYRLNFEGKPLAISSDGRTLAIPAPQGDAPRAGDVVAILSGPAAGKWRRIAQALGPTTFVLDGPIPTADCAISIAAGFVNESFEGNIIDCRGGSVAANLVLVGNHYGLRVIGNTFSGGSQAMLISAAPTEQPVHWGWSHAPVFGALIEGNVSTDSRGGGGGLWVEHSPSIKSNRGRTYMTVDLHNNTVQSTRPNAKARAWTIGSPGSVDPAELVFHQSGNHASAGASLWVEAALLDGRTVRAEEFPLTRAAAAAR